MEKMVDLINGLDHKRSTKVLVNGTTYEIDHRGVVEDVADTDAEKMLQSNAWALWDGSEPLSHRDLLRQEAAKRRKAAHEAAVKKNKAKQKAAAKNDKAAKAALAKAEKAEADADSDEDDPDADAGGGDPGGDAGDDKGEGEGGEDESPEDPPIPEEGGEWPDPSEKLSMEYLKVMAEAYEVKHAPNIGKAKLIERLKEEMYEDD